MAGYSHSIVAGGFEEMSKTTRFTPLTSLMIRFETRRRTSATRKARGGNVRTAADGPLSAAEGYSHSIVAGGFDEMSKTTRFTPETSLMTRFEIRRRSRSGSFAQSAVIPSRLLTARSTIAFS